MVFKYTATDKSNKKVRGTLDADSRPSAISELMRRGLFPTEVVDPGKAEDAKNDSILTRDISFVDIHKRKIKKKALLTFSNQIAIMIKAGVTLITAMDILSDEESDKSLKKILNIIKEDLQQGVSFSASMRKFRAFPEIMLSLVEAGEADGRLDAAFERISKSFAREIAISSKVKGAAIYPLVLLVLVFVMVMVVSIFVMPSFMDIFKQFDAELPPITMAVVHFSEFMASSWYIPLIGGAALVGLVILLYRRFSGLRLFLSRVLLKLPVIGKLVRRVYAARFCEVLSAMSNAGIDITEALRVSINTINNAHVKQLLSTAADEIRDGQSITAAFEKHNPFDRLLLSMIRTGEESGMLPDSLAKMSEMYEEQTEDSIKVLNSLIEPAMVILIAVVVVFVVISMVVPMFGIYDLVDVS